MAFLRCPNPDCPHLQKHGQAAEFVSGVEVCNECGTALVGASATPRPQTPAFASGPPPGRPWAGAAALTGAAGLAALALSYVWLPGLDRELLALGGETWRVGGLELPPASLVWGSFGLAPWLASFVVVELAALAVPAWRRLRCSGPRGREGLTRAAWAVGLLFAAVHAWLRLGELRTWDVLGNPVFVDVDSARWTGAALIAGAFASLLLAALISRRGLGNGFSVLLGVGAAEAVVFQGWGIVNELVDGSLVPRELLPVAIAVAGVVAIGWFLVGPSASPGQLPRPAAGTLGLAGATTALAVPSTLAVWTDDLGDAAPWLVPGSLTYSGLAVAVALVVTAGVVWLFYRPALVRPAWEAIGAEGDAAAAFASALRLALLFSTAFLVVAFLAEREQFRLELLSLLLLTAVGRDLVGEARFRGRHGDVEPAWAIHRLYLVEPALAALEAAGLPVYARGYHHRLLGQWTAPFVPVELLVPREQAADARRLIEERWPT